MMLLQMDLVLFTFPMRHSIINPTWSISPVKLGVKMIVSLIPFFMTRFQFEQH